MDSMKLFKHSPKNQTPLRVCIINFTGERKNWGCQATSWELVRILNRLWPQPKPFILEVIPLLPNHALDREIPEHYGNEIRAAFANPNPTEDQKQQIKDLSRKRYLHYVDMLERADVVLFQAEGTMTGTDFLRAERMLKVNWPIREISQQELLVADACQCLEKLESSRSSLKLQVAQLRTDIITAFQDCPERRIESFEPIKKLTLIPPAEQEVYLSINQQIASRFKYPEKDTQHAKLGAPQEILPQLITLTVYLRRNKYPEATFCCLRQLVQGNIKLVLNQLNSRWLVSICDSYADFGKPIEARNALLISTFLNWERLAASYIHWSEPSRTTRCIDNPVDPKNQPLWDGLVTVQLTRGDTINNLLIRYAKLLENTPHLLRIWHTLLDRLKNNDSVMSALNEPHGHMFDENLDWIKNGNYDGIFPPWRRL